MYSCMYAYMQVYIYLYIHSICIYIYVHVHTHKLPNKSIVGKNWWMDLVRWWLREVHVLMHVCIYASIHVHVSQVRLCAHMHACVHVICVCLFVCR